MAHQPPLATSAPILSTPETHLFENPTPSVDTAGREKLSKEELYLRYEIQRTVREIRQGRWKRVALQFEDAMLVHAVPVYEALRDGLLRMDEVVAVESDGKALGSEGVDGAARRATVVEEVEADMQNLGVGEGLRKETDEKVRLFILGDTSYGACCVDEIAAEHVDAQVVVHYGRACLSPTARLPVVYVFTKRPFDVQKVVEAFRDTYTDKSARIILMSDVPYSWNQTAIHEALKSEGYGNVFSTEIIHNPSSLLPNRTVPPGTENDPESLKSYQVFHIGHPPTALLFTLSSRISSLHLYSPSANSSHAKLSTTVPALRRRYALLTRLATTPIIGILLNTLSVSSYQPAVALLKQQIAKAGKKSYTFVVGKVNPAKIANFAEVGGWVVVGCWESSLVEMEGEFAAPLVTPFELSVALRGEGRVWTGEWEGGFESVLRDETKGGGLTGDDGVDEQVKGEDDGAEGDYDSEEESAPPEFDFRTGRYVSNSRPMRVSQRTGSGSAINGEATSTSAQRSSALVARTKGDVIQIGGVASPGAEFLRANRTWQGLGSDYEIDYTTGSDGRREGAIVEEGRAGVARGYTVGEDERRS